MKRLLALVLGALGLTALLKRRRERATVTSPADDLKSKLAESRTVAESEPTPPPPPADEPAAAPEAEVEVEPDVDARRADVHARARQAMDDLS